MEILVGADPEVFARNKQGELVSAYGLVPGTKYCPHPVNEGAVQVDGMALEFNIDPANTAAAFVHNIHSVLAQLKAMVPEHDIDISPVADFGHEFIAAQPDAARELGCDPDYNAYTGAQQTPPDGDLGFRTAAGHVHVGWGEGRDVNDPAHFQACCSMARELDALLYLPSLLLDPCEKRREMYGQVGAFRPKPYGMEYRVLSNFWLKHPDLITWVFNQVQKGFTNLIENGEGDINCKEIAAQYQGEELKQWLKENNIEVPDVQL